ncbi:MAG: pentapeptide repeat-containing protein [Arcobacteraceae bacterium]|jgi:uncharacterized protein YjbI with pentapeptide repeats|nr:pentapeptide repeat-containing protein [Arcobacteraceae bacterium]
MKVFNELSMESKRIYFFAFVLFIVVLVQFTFVREYINNNDFQQGIMTEAFGFIADIILFGIAITLYENFWKSKEQINRYLEELEDYRGWNEKEASYRVFGLIKRLHKLNKYDINLSTCYFENIVFYEDKFMGFNFSKMYFNKTVFNSCDISSSKFNEISCYKILDYRSFSNASFAIKFSHCNLYLSDFSNNKNLFLLIFNNESNLKGSNFNNSVLKYSTFDSVNLTNASFENAEFINCIFKDIDFEIIRFGEKVKFNDKCKFENCKNIPNGFRDLN